MFLLRQAVEDYGNDSNNQSGKKRGRSEHRCIIVQALGCCGEERKNQKKKRSQLEHEESHESAPASFESVIFCNAWFNRYKSSVRDDRIRPRLLNGRQFENSSRNFVSPLQGAFFHCRTRLPKTGPRSEFGENCLGFFPDAQKSVHANRAEQAQNRKHR